ncbi:pca operon transcription factor PcaQ [Natronospirillum operosum]|uniref:Pca operon transcription factor PcaQ n=1 Tax=Natronospirillum operosum TaxID=2759953 RepID=A0A4Z0WDT7_9GAMM|nr:pca operon transcription factor PcaQ [Natronospirillum operosum]TGG93392.1 pca operon transcription factor PcaQ [Natronospirillum operosum]
MVIDNRIKFRHLQCFIEVVRQGGVVKAADHLALTQPAVSKKLKELEEMLGVDLLDRQKKGVVLTPFGETFLRHALSSANALREGINSVQRARDSCHPPVTVGALPTVAARVMPAAVRRFKERLPDTTVNIITGPIPYLLGRLRVSELDIVIGRMGQPDDMQGLTFEQLYLERLALAVRPGHPVLEHGGSPLQALEHYPVIMPTGDSIIRNSVEKYLLAHGVSLNANQIETVSHAFARAYVRDTNAVWMISRGAVARDIEEGALVELDFDARETLGPVGFTRPVDALATNAMDVMISCVRAVSTSIVDEKELGTP